MKYTCLICGYMTLDSRHDWDICPVCFWEDDVSLRNGDSRSSANRGLYISEAQANFMIFESCSKTDLRHVRKPRIDEVKDPLWKPLEEAVLLAMKMRSEDCE